jgi:hypothetical protein
MGELIVLPIDILSFAVAAARLLIFRTLDSRTAGKKQSNGQELKNAPIVPN